MLPLLLCLSLAIVPQDSARTIAIDSRLAADRHLSVGDHLTVSATPGGRAEQVIVGAIVQRGADPAEIARGEYRIRMHLTQLQTLQDYGDRVDRFAIGTRTPAATSSAIARINDAAFGFHAHRSS